MTAAHVIPKETADGHKIVRTVRHPILDLALIAVEVPVGRVAKIADRTPAYGARLVVQGWRPDGLRMDDGRHGDRAGIMTAALAPGYSGGPVSNEQNELIGVGTRVGIFRAPRGCQSLLVNVSTYVSVVGLESWILEATRTP